MSNGHHQRKFVFVKPQNGCAGYFVLIDEVAVDTASDRANLVLHPNSSVDPTVVTDEQEYTWPIEGCNYSGHPVGVTIFLGTAPSEVDIRGGANEETPWLGFFGSKEPTMGAHGALDLSGIDVDTTPPSRAAAPQFSDSAQDHTTMVPANGSSVRSLKAIITPSAAPSKAPASVAANNFKTIFTAGSVDNSRCFFLDC
jgi:hypothetical protein